ncbi:MAG: SagB/ThcOx family dehydrogenase [Anaerolineales bacterium]|nr:SagB/ThcOx family dehydrogenase [Anaerolineales bacterium]
MDDLRKFLKGYLWEEWKTLETDQKKRIPSPPPQKPHPKEAQLIDLVPVLDIRVGNLPTRDAIMRRKSRRQYSGEALTIEELSYLVWATQGIKRIIREGNTITRTVPSAGSRHPFETYLFVGSVENLTEGLYRYLGLEHKLCFLYAQDSLRERVHAACYDQYVMESSVVFIWTAIPYRTVWRYGELAPKLIAQDSGHLCQNLYLACESIGVGVCAIGAYHQEEMDAILGVDGEEEFTVYLATVGRNA